jgi:hypothetical protein
MWRRPVRKFLKRLLRWYRRPQEYREGELCIRLVGLGREAMSVEYKRGKSMYILPGEWTGLHWEALIVLVPSELAIDDLRQLVSDLQLALSTMGWEYCLTQREPAVQAPEPEREKAVRERRR